MEEVRLDPIHQELLRYSKRNECEIAIKSTVTAEGNCPMMWDELMCWNETEPGCLAIQKCPDYIHGSQFKAVASKLCMDNGTWYIQPESGKPWTNYTLCFPNIDTTVVEPLPNDFNSPIYQIYIPILQKLQLTGYCVSLVALIIAFCIFASFKKLRCPRNIIHMHLFMSFIMRASFTLLKSYSFVRDIGFASSFVIKNEKTYLKYEEEEVNWECKMIISMWQYFILANYAWILMEGLYLHNLIFLALFTDTSSISLYIGLGWGLPTIFILPWIISRSLWEDILCWTTNEKWYIYMLIRTPMGLSNFINFILFINIVRVLLVKLRSSICEQTRKYRRWAKSTLVLMPLFGVHYMVFVGMSYFEGRNITVELIWLYGDQIFTSFQGFFVALLYCFLNGEVKSELAKKNHLLNYSKLFRWWPSNSGSTRDGMTNGMLGSSRFFSASRHRASCYSSTSCTSLSLGANSSWAVNKKREAGRGLSHVGLHGSAHSFLAESPPLYSERSAVNCHPNFADVKCLSWQERRRSKSDCNIADTSMELVPMTSQTQSSRT